MRTHEISVYKATPKSVYAYESLAVKAIELAFHEAAYMFMKTNGKLTPTEMIYIKTSQEALAFVSGTGLNVMIESYGLSFNADILRQEFYASFKIHPTS